jgi:Putative restriction endonuclease
LAQKRCRPRFGFEGRKKSWQQRHLGWTRDGDTSPIVAIALAPRSPDHAPSAKPTQEEKQADAKIRKKIPPPRPLHPRSFRSTHANFISAPAAGAEPDESWCIDGEKEFPDLVLEIALTSGGVRKLEIYQRFKVPEVWFWRRGKLELFALLPDGGAYESVERSRLLPALDPELLARCVAIRSWQEARRAFRAGLKGS